jgi:Zn-dependent M28 family amino/carboxypeptidase
MFLRNLALALALTALPLAAHDVYTLPAGADDAAKAIDAEMIRGHVAFLSDDLLEGRGPATRGDELARLYIASQLQALRIAPGMPDGGYEQRFDIVGVHAHPPASWAFRTKAGSEVAFRNSEDFIVASGVQSTPAAVNGAELVFVGYGIEAPEYKWDDYKGADLRGKVLVFLNNDPDWDPALFEGTRRLYYGRWTYKYEIAARKGAAGAIIIHTTPSAGYGWNVVQTSWTGEQFELPLVEGEPRVQLKGWLTEGASRQLLAAAGKDYDKLVQSARSRKFKPVALGVTTSMSMPVEVGRKATGNVIGVLPGTDLKDEYIVYTAHHDHLGVAEEGEGDRIYNGARDNALGVAQVLAIAKAFTELPEAPRRSIIFNFVAAEEQGLLGSQYYAANPTVAPGRMVANINLDGGNIFGRTKDVVQVGAGKSNIDDVVRFAAEKQGRVLKPEQFPDRGSYYRSDQFNFAKIGVPAIYSSSGIDYVDRPEGWGREMSEAWTAKHYHQPSDELTPEWDLGGAIQDAELAFTAGLVIATMDETPTWNPGDEFEAARKKALAELR